MRLCTIPNCEREHAARGWCLMHYKRWRNHGDPLKVLNPVGVDAFERWDAKVKRSAGCWSWQGSHDGRGYAMFHVGKRSADVTTHIVRAHIFGYETLFGPVPAGLELDHLCKNTGCVNPGHLEAVTHAENMARAKPDVCKWGHDDWRQGKKQRYCGTCHRQSSARRRAR